MSKKFIGKLKVRQSKQTRYFQTIAGLVESNTYVNTEFTLLEFTDAKKINYKFQLTDNLGNYDIILGRDFMTELSLEISYVDNCVNWDNLSVPLKQEGCDQSSFFIREESKSITESTNRIKRILDAKYEKADLPSLVARQSKLNGKQQKLLLALLEKYASLFDGTLGTFKDTAYNIELKEGAKPYHARPYPIPKIHEQGFRLEVERLCEIGVLKKVNRSSWGAPCFIIPKTDGTIRFLSDFRELNKLIRRKPFPLPKIQELLMKLEGFTMATSLDLNMGYYHIVLTHSLRHYVQ